VSNEAISVTDLFSLRSWVMFPNCLRTAYANPCVILKSADTPITRVAFNFSSKIFPWISRTFGVDFLLLESAVKKLLNSSVFCGCEGSKCSGSFDRVSENDLGISEGISWFSMSLIESVVSVFCCDLVTTL